MKTSNFFGILLISFGVATVTNSCTQTETQAANATTLTSTATEETQAAIINDDVDNEVDNYVTWAASSGFKAKSAIVTEVTSGPVITIDKPDSTNFPKTVTIDYGTSGITGKRGNVLTGKIAVIISNKMNIANSTKTITFDNFAVNGNVIKGSKIVTYKGLTSENQPYWTISVKDTVDRADGTTVTWNSERTRERIDNNGTPLIYWDDNYSIKGSSNGVNAKGKTYSVVIDAANPLIIGGGWPFFVKGSETITSETKTVIIDYGNGARDNIATATINGITKTFTLKK